MIFYMHECEEALRYTFKDKSLLRQCFTHSSYSHEHGNGKDNERLEFFGDSILGYVAAEYLMNKFPDADEGMLTEYKQQLVSRKPLASAIVKAGLDAYILYGEGERKNSPENHEAANENLFEAIVAGIYTDGGLDAARQFIRDFLFSKTRLVAGGARKSADAAEAENNSVKQTDYKSRLQIYVQKHKLGEIKYSLVSESGPAHEPVFSMDVSVGGRLLGQGVGRTKSEASKQAAETAFNKLIGGDNKEKPPREKDKKMKKTAVKAGRRKTEK